MTHHDRPDKPSDGAVARSLDAVRAYALNSRFELILATHRGTSACDKMMAHALREIEATPRDTQALTTPEARAGDCDAVPTHFIDGLGWVVACSDAARYIESIRSGIAEYLTTKATP